MKKSALRILVFLMLLASSRQSFPQHMFEVRGADTKYRYLDWNYTFGNSAVIDVFYVGVPGSNEFNLGGGWALKPSPSLTIVPLLYAVLAKEGEQRGFKVALLLMWEKNGFKVNSFLGHFAPVSGSISRYQVLDTLDFTRVMGKRWEAGVSAGFFHSEGTWNPQVGPMLKLNDRFGAWVVSYRFGPQKEFRAGRVLILKH